MKLKTKLYYCKSLKSSGKSIVVVDVGSGKTWNTDHIQMDNVSIRMSFNNADWQAKRSGVTTILEIWE